MTMESTVRISVFSAAWEMRWSKRYLPKVSQP